MQIKLNLLGQSRGGTAASGLVGQAKKLFEPRSGEENFLGPPRGVWGHAPPENFEN